jgi:hypothetical protein
MVLGDPGSLATRLKDESSAERWLGNRERLKSLYKWSGAGFEISLVSGEGESHWQPKVPAIPERRQHTRMQADRLHGEPAID